LADSLTTRVRERKDPIWQNANPLPGMTSSIQREDAFLVGLQVRDFPHHEYWEDGLQAPVCDLRAGDSVF
jgi:hypothetical protein